MRRSERERKHARRVHHQEFTRPSKERDARRDADDYVRPSAARASRRAGMKAARGKAA